MMLDFTESVLGISKNVDLFC